MNALNIPEQFQNKIIDGRQKAAQVRAEVAEQVKNLVADGLQPALAVILVGDDPASHIYVRNKIRACADTGIQSIEHRLPHNCPAQDLKALIKQLNEDKGVHGILLQLPLPNHLNANEMINLIDPKKDVDGLHPYNNGLLMQPLNEISEKGFVPCTPLGSLLMIQDVMPDIVGKNAVVVGASILCGKPMGQLLLRAQATVTQCHSKTQNLPDVCRNADILVVAVGRPHLVKGDWIKEGAVVIDIGINKLEDGSITGDVDFNAALERASAITPVPGGAGPMTIACLMRNTLQAAKQAHGK
jgi:methylenetetrahydrofolate dehydrogenase (NADP+)/methenyltetrahydrofolate cyclohydrolase